MSHFDLISFLVILILLAGGFALLAWTALRDELVSWGRQIEEHRKRKRPPAKRP